MGFSGQVLQSDLIGRGSTFGLRHKGEILIAHRGEETRMIGWGKPIRTFKISKLATREQSDRIRRFILQHAGARDSFYIEDPMDHTTALDGHSAYSSTDEWVGIGIGSSKTYPLLRRCERGTMYERSRRAYGVDSSKILVAVNDGVNGPAPTADFTLDTVAGTITINAPAGHEITAGFRYKTRVFFDDTTDKKFGATYIGTDTDELTFDMMEEKLPAATPERMVFGATRFLFPGGSTVTQMLEIHRGQYYIVQPSSPLNILLPEIRGESPDEATVSYGRRLVFGGPYCHIHNSGTATITLFEKVEGAQAGWRQITANPTITAGKTRSLIVASAHATHDPNGLAAQVWRAS